MRYDCIFKTVIIKFNVKHKIMKPEKMQSFFAIPNFFAVTKTFSHQAHTSKWISFDTVVNGINHAQVNAGKKYCIKTQLIMCS
jgi:hypothetical protein